jgi:phosphohistidine phosphatase
MRRLILFRHGKAEAAPAAGGDRERDLTERGKADSANTGAWLAAAGFVPDLVLVSPSARTRSTWDRASPSLPGARVESPEDLYLAGAEAVMAVLTSAPDEADTVMVVGHNPGLQELAARLAAEATAPTAQVERIADGFPTAAACVIRMEGSRATALEAVYQPPRPGERAPRWEFVAAKGGDRD